MFVKAKDTSMVDYDVLAWQKYFGKHGRTRTICLDCQTTIEKFHVGVKKELRGKEMKKMMKNNKK